MRKFLPPAGVLFIIMGLSNSLNAEKMHGLPEITTEKCQVDLRYADISACPGGEKVVLRKILTEPCARKEVILSE